MPFEDDSTEIITPPRDVAMLFFKVVLSIKNTKDCSKVIPPPDTTMLFSMLVEP